MVSKPHRWTSAVPAALNTDTNGTWDENASAQLFLKAGAKITDITSDPVPAVADREFDITRDGQRVAERHSVPAVDPASAGRHVYQYTWTIDGNLVIRTRQRSGALAAHSLSFVIDQ